MNRKKICYRVLARLSYTRRLQVVTQPVMLKLYVVHDECIGR